MIFFKKSMLLIMVLQCSMLFAAPSKAELEAQQRAKVQEEAKKVNINYGWTGRPIFKGEKVDANELRLQELLIKNIAKRMAVADKEYAKVIAAAAKKEEKESPFKRYKHACIMAERARTELERRRIFDYDFLFLKESKSNPQDLINQNNQAKDRLRGEIHGFEQKINQYKKEALGTVEASEVTKECRRYYKELLSVKEAKSKQFIENERQRQEMRYQEHEFFRKHLKYVQAGVEEYRLRLVKMNAYKDCVDGTADESVSKSIASVQKVTNALKDQLEDQLGASQTTGRFHNPLL